MRLKGWANSWGLPSVDPDCLCILTYAKFTQAPVELEETIPSKAVARILPELQVGDSVYTSTLNILGILRKEGFNADFNLSTIEHSETFAYVAMVEEKLKPGFLQNLWVDSGNYVNVTRPAYCKSFGFLRSYWDLPQMRHKMEVDLHVRGAGTLLEREAFYYKEAKSCISHLSFRLGTNEYFFGSSPTTLDAIVFSHLSILLKAPLVSTVLKNHLLGFENLCKYCARISQKYFNDTDAKSSYSTEPEKKEKTETKTLDFKEKKSEIISVTVAVVAMIVYGVAMGVFTRKGGKTAKGAFLDIDDMVD